MGVARSERNWYGQAQQQAEPRLHDPRAKVGDDGGRDARLIVAGFAAPSLAHAQDSNPHPVDRDANTRGTTGQLNVNWGIVASNIARLDTTAEGGTGGAMGQHSRSTQAADINGGFANSDNGFGITLSDNTDGSPGRLGSATRRPSPA